MASAAGVKSEENEFSLENLEEIEAKVCNAVSSAGQVILELSKDKVNERTMEHYTNNFASSLEDVESQLSKQINYLIKVATNQQHEGSSYAARYNAHVTSESLTEISDSFEKMIKKYSSHPN